MSTSLIRHQPFLQYLLGRGFAEFSYQIATVAVGWQVYALTGSAFDLGMVGLAQFVPTVLLTFVAGHVADRYDRRRIVMVCQIVDGSIAAFLAWGSFAGWLQVHEIFAAVVIFGTTIAFEGPAAGALLPGVSPDGMLQKATALSTGVMQAATISGPALGGVAYAVSPGVPYAVMAVFSVLAGMLSGTIKIDRRITASERPTLGALFAGVAFVRRNPAILGTISLDLFAVLLGGATALMPIYASDILHTGPWGLGVLRGAPAVGALVMTGVLARYAINRRAGMRMFQAVIVFGVATIVFALSHSLWLSIGALAVMGAADTISMVIRISLVQSATPDEMRGRVGAVNYLFVNTSYQLGEFESGMTAALFGAMPAAVLGGVGTIAVALLWMKLFPTLRRVERVE
ncbi:MFS transporter [Acidisphaera sp. S103]|uniref:MFS transporter n=1 Tax=Acidisphaera sp. S103 TaxID=1747223 RepID=UPI00131DB3FB|nr:MFS transporter [Acidisphaera sp. S103]